MSIKCIVCMDSKYLAISKEDPELIVPMLNLTGSELTDYRLESCSCNKTNKVDVWKQQVETQCSQEKLSI